MPRDDFSEKVKTELARRVSRHCSICGCSTDGPDALGGPPVNIGMASHITAAAPGGPRYDLTLTSDQRADFDNGIWTCRNCGKKVDGNDSTYTVEDLLQFKQQAESRAATELGIPISVHQTAPYQRIPLRIANFTGRTATRLALHALLQSPGSLALVHGQPGTGKSSLLTEVAHSLAPHFPSILFVECGPDSTPTSVGIKLNALLPTPDPSASPDAQLAQVKTWLATHSPALLVLDDVRSDDIAQAFADTHASILLAAHDRERNAPLAQLFPLEGFTESERIEYLTTTLGPNVYADRSGDLTPFAHAFEDHPFPWSILVGILSKQSYKTPKQRLEQVRLETLSHGTKDLAAYYALAVSYVSPDAQLFLHSLAACAPGPAPVCFILEVAGLPQDKDESLTEELFHAALLRPEAQGTVYIHSLLRAWSRYLPDATKLQDQHARAVQARFNAWKESTRNTEGETAWRTCLEIESQVLPAIHHAQFKWTYIKFRQISEPVCEACFFMGQLNIAQDVFGLRIAAARSHNDDSGLQTALGNQALILRAWGQLPKALALLKQQEQICRNLEDRTGLYRALGNQATIFQAWGQLPQALELHKQEEQICRNINDHAGLSTSLGNQALILKAWGQLPEALALLKQQKQICRDLNDRSGLSRSLGNQALILINWGQLPEALALLKQQEQICRDLNDRSGLSLSLGNQALILKDWGQFPEALALHKQKEQICRDINIPNSLAISLANQATILHAQCQLTAAKAALTEAESLARTHGYAPLLTQILEIKSALFP